MSRQNDEGKKIGKESRQSVCGNLRNLWKSTESAEKKRFSLRLPFQKKTLTPLKTLRVFFPPPQNDNGELVCLKAGSLSRRV